MLSRSQNVRLCVRVCVLVSACSLLRYRLNVFLTPLPKVGCPKVLEIQNPWGKVVERWVSDLNIFAQKRSKIAAAKKVFMDKKSVPF